MSIIAPARVLVLVLAPALALTACSREASPPPAPSSSAPASSAASSSAPSSSAASSSAPASSAPGSSAPGSSATASSVTSSLPADPARDMVLGRCTICHDESYLPQQRLGVEQWQKTVAKMQGFGAPVAAEEVPVIAAYLARSFPASAPDVTPALVPKPPSGLPRAVSP